jgi:WD40 repeat protein
LGYENSAQALERESNTTSSSQIAAKFLALLQTRRYDSALALVDQLPFKDGSTGRKRAKNFIVQERYLDSLLNDKVDEALSRLQEEVFYLHHENESDLDELAALLACPTFDDLVQVSGRLRAKQARRCYPSSPEEIFDTGSSLEPNSSTAIECIRALLDSDAVVPPKRMYELFGQAIARQLTTSGIDSNSPSRDNTNFSRFDNEPMPLLKQVKEVEERRNAEFAPNRNCRQIIKVDEEDDEEVISNQQLDEIWCVCFHPSAPKFAVGTRYGSVLTYELDPVTTQAREVNSFDAVFGRGGVNSDRPITSLDWTTGDGDDGVLLCVSRQQKSHPTNRRESSSSVDDAENDGADDNDDDDEGDADEDIEDVRDVPLVQTLLSKSKHAFSSRDVYHGGRPCARWVAEGERIATAGIDGWYKIWKYTEDSMVCASAVAVERVVDLTYYSRLQAVFLACADLKIRVFQESKPVLTIAVPEPIMSMNCGGNSLVVALKSPILSVWNINEMNFTSESNSSTHTQPALTYRGFSAKKFIVKPSVGFGDFIACGGENGAVHVWSSTGNPGKEVVVLKGHSAVVNEVCFSPTIPGLLLSVGDDGCIRIWSKRSSTDEDE